MEAHNACDVDNKFEKQLQADEDVQVVFTTTGVVLQRKQNNEQRQTEECTANLEQAVEDTYFDLLTHCENAVLPLLDRRSPGALFSLQQLALQNAK